MSRQNTINEQNVCQTCFTRFDKKSYLPNSSVNYNQKIRCNKCRRESHRYCYDPSCLGQQFICDPCRDGKLKEECECVVCHNTGLLKRVGKQKYGHVICLAFNINYFAVTYGKLKFIETHIKDQQNIKGRTWLRNCNFCSRKSHFYNLIKCSAKNCKNYAHLYCIISNKGWQEFIGQINGQKNTQMCQLTNQMFENYIYNNCKTIYKKIWQLQPKKIIYEDQKPCNADFLCKKHGEELREQCFSCRSFVEGEKFIQCECCLKWSHYSCQGIYQQPSTTYIHVCQQCQNWGNIIKNKEAPLLKKYPNFCFYDFVYVHIYYQARRFKNLNEKDLNLLQKSKIKLSLSFYPCFVKKYIWPKIKDKINFSIVQKYIQIQKFNIKNKNQQIFQMKARKSFRYMKLLICQIYQLQNCWNINLDNKQSLKNILKAFKQKIFALKSKDNQRKSIHKLKISDSSGNQCSKTSNLSNKNSQQSQQLRPQAKDRQQVQSQIKKQMLFIGQRYDEKQQRNKNKTHSRHKQQETQEQPSSLVTSKITKKRKKEQQKFVLQSKARSKSPSFSSSQQISFSANIYTIEKSNTNSIKEFTNKNSSLQSHSNSEKISLSNKQSVQQQKRQHIENEGLFHTNNASQENQEQVNCEHIRQLHQLYTKCRKYPQKSSYYIQFQNFFNNKCNKTQKAKFSHLCRQLQLQYYSSKKYILQGKIQQIKESTQYVLWKICQNYIQKIITNQKYSPISKMQKLIFTEEKQKKNIQFTLTNKQKQNMKIFKSLYKFRQQILSKDYKSMQINNNHQGNQISNTFSNNPILQKKKMFETENKQNILNYLQKVNLTNRTIGQVYKLITELKQIDFSCYPQLYKILHKLVKQIIEKDKTKRIIKEFQYYAFVKIVQEFKIQEQWILKGIELNKKSINIVQEFNVQQITHKDLCDYWKLRLKDLEKNKLQQYSLTCICNKNQILKVSKMISLIEKIFTEIPQWILREDQYVYYDVMSRSKNEKIHCSKIRQICQSFTQIKFPNCQLKQKVQLLYRIMIKQSEGIKQFISSYNIRCTKLLQCKHPSTNMMFQETRKFNRINIQQQILALKESIFDFQGLIIQSQLILSGFYQNQFDYIKAALKNQRKSAIIAKYTLQKYPIIYDQVPMLQNQDGASQQQLLISFISQSQNQISITQTKNNEEQQNLQDSQFEFDSQAVRFRDQFNERMSKNSKQEEEGNENQNIPRGFQ